MPNNNEIVIKDVTEEEKVLLGEEQYSVDEVELAEVEFEKVLSRSLSTDNMTVKVTDQAGNIVAILCPTMTHSAPIIQIPRDTLDFYCQGSATVDTGMFSNYRFEKLFVFKTNPEYPVYSAKINELVDNYVRANGSERLRYCFTVKQKVGFGSISIFIDSITKNFVGIQGLELFIGTGVKNNKNYTDNSIHVQKVTMFKIGAEINGSSDIFSPGTMVTTYGSKGTTLIQPNSNSTVDEIFDKFVTNNNNIRARYISISSASMYSGKDGTYQLVSSSDDNIHTIKANTPPLLVIELGTQENLVPRNEDDSVPNVILCQSNALNNFYLYDNVKASDAQSNFCIMLPVY